MAVTTYTFAHTADAVVVNDGGVTGLPYSVLVRDGHAISSLYLSTQAAESLSRQLSGLLSIREATDRETAYQEQQVKDAVENGISAEPEPGWVYIDHERRITREQDQ